MQGSEVRHAGSPEPPQRHKADQSSNEPHAARHAVRAALFVVAYHAALLALAGSWHWPEAWLITGLQVAVWTAASRAVAHTNPSLFAERATATRHANTQPFDRLLMPLLVTAILATPFAAALEQRAAASRSLPRGPVAVAMVALAAFAAALALEAAALTTNRWFSSVVRLQPERGHAVCDSGVYAAVRHPGYAGALLQAAAEAALLRSRWAAALCMSRGAVLVARTVLEDAWLHGALPGYAGYARRVRWRLVPGVW